MYLYQIDIQRRVISAFFLATLKENICCPFIINKETCKLVFYRKPQCTMISAFTFLVSLVLQKKKTLWPNSVQYFFYFILTFKMHFQSIDSVWSPIVFFGLSILKGPTVLKSEKGGTLSEERSTTSRIHK